MHCVLESPPHHSPPFPSSLSLCSRGGCFLASSKFLLVPSSLWLSWAIDNLLQSLLLWSHGIFPMSVSLFHGLGPTLIQYDLILIYLPRPYFQIRPCSQLMEVGVELQHIFSVQFSHSVMSDSLRPHESQHTRPLCPSPTPRVYPNSCPLSRWCHPIISCSVIPFSSSPLFFPASEFV